jgi:hypothetical protein
MVCICDDNLLSCEEKAKISVLLRLKSVYIIALIPELGFIVNGTKVGKFLYKDKKLTFLNSRRFQKVLISLTDTLVIEISLDFIKLTFVN